MIVAHWKIRWQLLAFGFGAEKMFYDSVFERMERHSTDSPSGRYQIDGIAVERLDHEKLEKLRVKYQSKVNATTAIIRTSGQPMRFMTIRQC